MSLPWIKIYHTLPDHPKAEVLGGLLQTPRAWTHVVELWLWAARVCPSGDLSGLSAESVARRAGWTGDPQAFVGALRRAGFLDGYLLHGWGERQSAHAARLEYDKARAKKNRENNRFKKRPTDVPSRPQSRPTDVLVLEGEGEGELNTKNLPPFENPKVGTRENSEVDGATGQQMLIKPTLAALGRDFGAGMGQDGTPVQKIAPDPVSVDLAISEQALKPKRGRPRKDNPEWQAEQADGARWLEAARKVNGLGVEHAKWDTSTWLAFRRARKRYTLPTLLASLTALEGDPWASQQGLRALLADAVVQKGLATKAKGSRMGVGINATWNDIFAEQQAVKSGQLRREDAKYGAMHDLDEKWRKYDEEWDAQQAAAAATGK